MGKLRLRGVERQMEVIVTIQSWKSLGQKPITADLELHMLAVSFLSLGGLMQPETFCPGKGFASLWGCAEAGEHSTGKRREQPGWETVTQLLNPGQQHPPCFSAHTSLLV